MSSCTPDAPCYERDCPTCELFRGLHALRLEVAPSIADAVLTLAKAALARAREQGREQGAEEMRGAALQAAQDEEELDGPIPAEVRKAILWDPENALRASVIATKRGIEKRIRALPLTPERGEEEK